MKGILLAVARREKNQLLITQISMCQVLYTVLCNW